MRQSYVITRMPARARRLLIDVKCLLTLTAMRLALSLRGYAAIRARMPGSHITPDAHFYARQLARRIERLAHLVPGASCLTQALALEWLLARAGHGCELLVGVRRDEEGRFVAHAWVTCNDRIVLGASMTRIEDFTTLAGAR